MKSTIKVILTITISILLLIFLLSISVKKLDSSEPNGDSFTIALPEATNYVVNDNGALKQETVDSLNKELKELDNKAQIAVLILDSTSPYTIEEYGIRLADKWKVGYSGLDNGAIIILATKDRKVRIEVGKGLEGVIPDAAAGRIIDEYMMPPLKEGNYDIAIINAVGAIKNIILNVK